MTTTTATRFERIVRLIDRGRAIMARRVAINPRPPEPLANRLRRLVRERNRMIDESEYR